MPISRPRTSRISSSDSARRSRPLKRISPPTMRPAGAATSRITDSALTDLPQPDSPTRATVSPLRTSHETPSTARTTPAEVWNWVRRSRTSRRTSSQAASLPYRSRRSAGAERHPLLDARQGGAERVAVLHPARLEPAPEPPRALPGRAVGPGLGRDAAAGLLLDAVVAHRGGGRQGLLDVALARAAAARRVECAQTPARQSACSSSRTDRALRPRRAGPAAPRTSVVDAPAGAGRDGRSRGPARRPGRSRPAPRSGSSARCRSRGRCRPSGPPGSRRARSPPPRRRSRSGPRRVKRTSLARSYSRPRRGELAGPGALHVVEHERHEIRGLFLGGRALARRRRRRPAARRRREVAPAVEQREEVLAEDQAQHQQDDRAAQADAAADAQAGAAPGRFPSPVLEVLAAVSPRVQRMAKRARARRR